MKRNMVHRVMCDGEVINVCGAVPERLFADPKFRTPEWGVGVDYRALKAAFKAEKIDIGEVPEAIRELGYIDLDTMEGRMLQSPVASGNYAPILGPVLKQITMLV